MCEKDNVIDEKNENRRSFAKFQEMTSEFHDVPIWIEKTVNRFGEFKGTAYDLGCGAGNDTMYLLKKNWKVIAIDREIDVISKKKSELDKELQKNLQILKMSFENLKLEEKCDLIIAINSLPFCTSDKFDLLWKNIKESLKIGGRIAITLFGVNDEFNKDGSKMTFFTRSEILELLKDFKIEGKTGDIIEKEFDGRLASGVPHHWHKYIIMARKIK